MSRLTGAGSDATGWRLGLVLRVTGAGLLVATGAVHLDLYLTGYRTVPTIGWLFLVQLTAAFALGLIVLVFPSRLVSAAGAGFAMATLGGYLLSLRAGLFGFREVRTAAGVVAGVIEVLSFAALAAFVLGPRAQPQPVGPAGEGLGSAGESPGPAADGTRLAGVATKLADRLQSALPMARWVAFAFSVLAAVLLGALFATAGPVAKSAGSSTTILKIDKVHGVPVLTDAQGYTLYWFAPDTPTRSTCYATCALYWPPLTGSPVAGPGVSGKLGTIRRSGGATQVTYDGHPLYTYVGDSAPGQANGNDINLNGGFWYEVAAAR
jgi:predicted lipoprotein with Yx(FWY)xxD motif